MQKLAPLFLLLALGFGTFGFYQQSQMKVLRERLAVLESAAKDAEVAVAEVPVLKEKVESQKAVITQLEVRNKELAAKPAPAEAASPDQAAGEKKDGGNFMSGLAKMFNDPKTRDAMKAQQGAQVSLLYGGLAQELGLAPDLARQLMALLTDRQTDLAAKGMAMFDKGANDPAAMKAATDETNALKKTYDDQLKGLLGEDGFKKFNDYEQTMPDRVALDQIQRQLAATGTTIEPAQQKSLLEIMAAERKATKTPTGMGAEGMKMLQDDKATEQFMASQEEMNRRVLARARTVLNADQAAAFEQAQKQFLDMQKMGIQMSRQMFGGKK